MPDLKYKAKMGNIHGKPRAYFACHPQDFDRCFEALSQEIMEIINCAIFYYDPREHVPLDDDYYMNLNQMQLFVMPVTKNLLRQNSRAMDVEFPFAAKERHIPVLPIMLEDGLTEEFGQKFGNLQYLNRASQDDTELPYHEKLKSRLESVLVGDELAAKIRTAFDAHIFLSYRKKDRAYAQELMKLIHRNEFCRDIAIWYDEFLTPGEDFNHAIADALTKSDLFVLAITPNVVNETNYIMTTEYPMAREKHKPILPAELTPTDHRLLYEKYRGCPDCIDAHDERALSAAIVSGLRNLALRENEQDPQHNFFMGLAYLNGIDVEVDRNRALKLISGAAEAGLIEALHKARDMYLNGEGVRADMAMTAYWTRKLAARLEEQYRKEPTQANGALLAKAYWDLGDYLEELKKPEEAMGAYERMEQVSRALATQWENPETRRMFALSFSKLGSICTYTGNSAKAWEYLQQAQKYFQHLYHELRTPRAAWDLAIVMGRLGNLIYTERPQEALDLYMLEMRLLQEAESNPDSSDRVKLRVARNKAALCNSISRLFYSVGQYKEARDYVRQSIRITNYISRVDGGKLSLNSWRDLAASYALEGDIACAEKQWDEAVKYYEESVELCYSYNDYDVSLLYNVEYVLEEIHMMRGDWKKAEVSCRNRLTLLPKLCDPESPKGKTELVNAHNRLARIYSGAGRLNDAVEQLLTALEYDWQLYQFSPTEETADSITYLYGTIGDIYSAAGQAGRAESYYLKGLKHAEYVYETFQSMETGCSLADCHRMLAGLYQQNQRPADALAEYDKGLSIYDQVLARWPKPEIAAKRLPFFRCMGDIYYDANLPEDARSCYKAGLSAAASLSEVSQAPAIVNSLALAHYKLALVSKGMECVENLKDAIHYWSVLSKQYPDNPDYAENAQKVQGLLNHLYHG